MRKQRKIQKHTSTAPRLICPVLQMMYLRGKDPEEPLLGSHGGDEGEGQQVQAPLSTGVSPSLLMVLVWENAQGTAPEDMLFTRMHVCACTYIHTHPHRNAHTYAHNPTVYMHAYMYAETHTVHMNSNPHVYTQRHARIHMYIYHT